MQRGKPKLRYSKLEFSGRERGRRAFVALVVVVGGGVESITPSSRKEEEDLDTHTHSRCLKIERCAEKRDSSFLELEKASLFFTFLVS